METTYYHPTMSLLIDSDEWLDIDPSSTPYASVFEHQGLLTDRLALIADDAIFVQCVSQKFDQADTAQRRDVVIFVDEGARVLASTIIPSTVLEHYPLLATLGNNPIGEHLETNYDAKRGKPKFRAVPDQHQLNQNFNGQGVCYLRKYDYILPKGKITIVELFSSEILIELQELIESTKD